MESFGNRDVFLIGSKQDNGLKAEMLWLKTDNLFGTKQIIYSHANNERLGLFSIPKAIDQIHIDTFLPYAYLASLEN